MHQRTRSTQPIRAMPRTVARASPRTVATSLPTIHSIPNSVPATMQTQVRIQYLDEIEEVVSRLRRNSVRASHIDIPPDKPRVTFNIDQHTELIALIKQKSNEKQHSHAFGIVHGPGVTVLGGPYSYTMAIVEATQDIEYTISDIKPDRCNLIQGLGGGFSVQVTSGRLVGMVVACSTVE